MKKLILLGMGLLTAAMLVAQTHDTFNYQAVVRDATGAVLPNKGVSFRISIIQGTVTGTIVYTEKHHAVTNPFGLVTLEIGKGEVVTGSIGSINWGVDRHFINVELDPNGGSTFQFMGAQELLSVPYAMHAKTTATGDNWGAQTVVTNTGYFTGNGTTASPLSLSPMGASTGQVLKWNGTAWDNAADDNGPWSENTNYIYNSTSKRFGIGINIPTQKMTLAEAGNYCYMNFQNSSTGFTSSDGLMLGTSATDGILTNVENGKLFLGANNSVKMTIEPGGDVGIGTAAPGYKLDVTGAVNLNRGVTEGVALRCNGDEAIWYNGTYFSWGFGGTYNYFRDPIGIDCQPGDGHKLAVNGVASKPGGGTWAAFSDSRLKDVHGNYTRGLAEIIRLQPVSYNYRNGNEMGLPSDPEYVGFIAQEVQPVFPEAITETSSGYLEFDMHYLNVAIINAIKELKVENDRLKNENEQLRIKLEQVSTEFESRLNRLESMAGVSGTK